MLHCCSTTNNLPNVSGVQTPGTRQTLSQLGEVQEELQQQGLLYYFTGCLCASLSVRVL